MRADVVELVEEGVEASLLGSEIGFGWFRRFVLQSAMHPLMNAVLLRLAWFDPHVLNAQFDPHLGELSHSAQRSGRAKRHAIVGDDLLGQSPLSKDSLEDFDGWCDSCRSQRFGREDVSTARIRQSQWIAVATVSHSELSLVIR